MLKPFSVGCLGSKCLSPRPVLNNFTHDTVPFKQLMFGGQEVLWLVYKNTIHVVRIYIVQDMFFVAKTQLKAGPWVSTELVNWFRGFFLTLPSRCRPV